MKIITVAQTITIDLRGDTDEVQQIVTTMLDLIRVLVMLSNRTQVEE